MSEKSGNGSERAKDVKGAVDSDEAAAALQQEILKEVGEEEVELKNFLTIACMKRYLRARDGNAKKALSVLKKTLKWRREERPDKLRCPACDENPLAHNMRLIGYDQLGRPVVYTCFAHAQERKNVKNGMAHLTMVLEDSIRMMEGEEQEKWVWVIDFYGFGIVDCNPATATNASKILTDHYPERLGLAVILDAPMLFSGLFKAIKPILNKVTAEKIHFVKMKNWEEEVRSNHFDEELIAWLRREVAENRDPSLHKVKGQEKKYWEWRHDNGELKEHDPRGTPSLLNHDKYVPPVLEHHIKSWKHEEGEGGSEKKE